MFKNNLIYIPEYCIRCGHVDKAPWVGAPQLDDNAVLECINCGYKTCCYSYYEDPRTN